ncbi:MAG: PIN domain-containing protein [Verrucomicrobiae bacterium]|nr:PIN domain-containing protein [Verrucomicrobiae bacterium]
MKSVYIETSVISYLTSRPSRDILAVAHQQITCEWWDAYRGRFEIFISPLVDQECRRGDAEAAERRVAALCGLRGLEIVEDAYKLASAFIEGSALPSSAQDDATHIALAAVHGIDYLLTWNCRHIDNAETKPIIRSICAINGYTCPEICTPEELMGGENED